jgi:hypothetical protein
MSAATICPYPGLRPFTVEESIYFKGRDANIDRIIQMMEERKFLMLTGASGDGKSSLVYAGVIPNAQAGFFKAKFNQWKFVDFTPSRTPMQNLAEAVAEKLELELDYVKEELSYGFSALADLYMKSPFYLDENSDEFKKANKDEQKAMKKKASNFFILVDQFEEFYTNPENYVNGKPSLEAVTVMNLLLETAKLAHEQNLPIYVIFTMRSDYIGHCAAFRGLPEFIGFSQFFVPRLKRKEIYQVIAEPAKLAGVTISQRLVETLINELSDGFDQLPVLQHALNQVFHVADEGEEMDLIHLAKLSGMPPDELPDESQGAFDNWFLALPERKKQYFKDPSLANVLNLHANDLYESSYEHATQYVDSSQLSEEDAHQIIRKIFQCLTKTDENRAVRNRMTLGEIKSIIDDPRITAENVTGVLNIFREQGNTFVRPFITKDKATHSLTEDTVLDITHEALIRNWDSLAVWAEEEYDNYLNYQDFRKQLDRWIENDRSAGYLLPVGPLRYFEGWYERANPNAYWLAKYDDRAIDHAQKLAESEQALNDIRDFIKKSNSAIEEIESRKKRMRKIMVAAASIIILALSALSFWAFMEKQQANEQKLMAEQQKQAAEEATLAAQEAKSAAERSAEIAVLEKERADSLFLGAINAKDEADRERLMATHQRFIAQEEARKAEEQRLVAQTEKEKAQSEKQRAEGAEENAKQLSLLALAQSLALKASLYDEDNTVKALLAAQAYKFNKDNGGNSSDAVIYDAVLSGLTSMSKAGFNALRGLRAEPRSMRIAGDKLTTAGKDGRLISWTLSGRKVTRAVDFGIQYKSPINFVFQQPGSEVLVTGHDNFSVLYWTLAPGSEPKKVELKKHKGLVRAITFSTNGSQFATGGKDKVIHVWNVNGGNPQLAKSIPTTGAIVGMEWIDSKLYVITDKWSIDVVDVSAGTISQMKKTAAFPKSMTYNKKRNQLVVGLQDGSVGVYSLSSGKLVTTFKDHTAGVDQLAVSMNGRLLASASPDGSIKIYDLNNLKWNPISITNHRSKVRTLGFDSKNRVFAGLANNKVMHWDSNADPIQTKISKAITRNLTQAEWSKYIGSDVQYEKTFVNLP